MSKKESVKGLSVKKLLEIIPDEIIEELSEELSVDKWVKKLKAKYVFKLVLFSILSSERLSLRIMEENFQDPIFQSLAPALLEKEASWTAIRNRLINTDVCFYQKIYETIYNEASDLYGEELAQKYNLRRHDSTMIATFSHLLEGMQVGNTSKGKTQVKLTTEFTNDFLMRMHFYKDQEHLSEQTALKENIEKSESGKKQIHVFDKGLQSRLTFKAFSNQGIQFVTRIHEKPRYELLRPHSLDDGFQDSEELEFIQDSIVHLYESGHKLCKKEFRLIQYHIKGTDKTLSFLTNILELPPLSIAGIYKSRWDIEVLFRFMKQEMNLSHFVCNDTNAIQTMLYCTLMASMLILIYKKKNNIKSFKKAKIRFFKELLYSIFLEALENPDETKRLKNAIKKFMLLE